MKPLSETDPTARSVVAIVKNVVEGRADVILFGSRGRDTHRDDSDVDIIVDARNKVEDIDDVYADLEHLLKTWPLDVTLDLNIVNNWSSPTQAKVFSPLGSSSYICLDEICDHDSNYCGDCHVCGRHNDLYAVNCSDWSYFFACDSCNSAWERMGSPKDGTFRNVLHLLTAELGLEGPRQTIGSISYLLFRYPIS